jgi:hypothetical protein
VAVAIEASRGAAVYAMMERAWLQLFPVHPATSTHQRRAFRPLYVSFHLPCSADSRTGSWSPVPPGRGERGGAREDVHPWQRPWPRPRPAASRSQSLASLLVQTRTVA